MLYKQPMIEIIRQDSIHISVVIELEIFSLLFLRKGHWWYLWTCKLERNCHTQLEDNHNSWQTHSLPKDPLSDLFSMNGSSSSLNISSFFFVSLFFNFISYQLVFFVLTFIPSFIFLFSSFFISYSYLLF